jgi:hypothetical protein
MPEDARRPGPQWVRSETASHGRIEARPIALEGWIALLAFAAMAVAVPLAIWLGMVLPGHMSAALAIVWTVMAEAILVAAFVLLVQLRMDAPAHEVKSATDGWDQTFQILW